MYSSALSVVCLSVNFVHLCRGLKFPAYIINFQANKHEHRPKEFTPAEGEKRQGQLRTGESGPFGGVILITATFTTPGAIGVH